MRMLNQSITKLTFSRTLAIILLCLLCLTPTALFSEPMMPAKIEEAITCNWIVIASYQGHEDLSKLSYATNPGELYMRGLTANYRVEKILKNTSGSNSNPLPGNTTVHVTYSFHDFTPCMPDTSFHFTDNMMPARGSRWILFLERQNDLQQQSAPGCFWTYRGEKGRLAANPANIQEITKQIRDSASDPHHYRQADNLSLTFFSDEEFAQLDGCNKLEALYITCGPSVIGKGLKWIQKLPALRTLVLSGEHINDQSLENIAGQETIDFFSLSAPLVTDTGITHLHGLKRLNKLLLLTPRVNGSGLSVLRESPHLEDLILNDCHQFSGSTIAGIASLTSLHNLQMSNCPNITDTGLKHLKGLKNLAELQLDCGLGIKGSGLKYLAQLPQMKRLRMTSSSIDDDNLPSLSGASIELLNFTFSQITDKGVPSLKTLPNLTDLTISNPQHPLTDTAIEYLVTMPKLSRLNLNFSNVTDKGVAELTKLPNLEHLALAQTKITRTSIEYLEHMPKLKTVELADTGITSAEANRLTYVLYSRHK